MYWQSQDFKSGGARLKDKIEGKINLRNINRYSLQNKSVQKINKQINKQLYAKVIVIHNLI